MIGKKGLLMNRSAYFLLALAGLQALAPAQIFAPAGAQQLQPAIGKEDNLPLYFHSYRPVLSGNFQLQPGQGFSILEPFGGFVRMVQVCVREVKSAGPMPVPTPMLATRRSVDGAETTGVISVGSCAVIEGDSIAVGLADGKVDSDISDANPARKLTVLSGSYTVLGYYSRTAPLVPDAPIAR